MNNKQIERAARDYSGEVMPSYSDGYFEMSQIADAFEEGALWRINSVWHGMDHVANPDLLLLVRLEEDEYELAFWPKLDGSGDFPTFTFDRWKEWAYVKNLLPERKEEQP